MDDIEYEDYKVNTVHMKQTLTAAGKLTTGKVNTLDFPRGKSVKVKAVDKNEAVRKGQPLIYYTDGTYTAAPDAGIITGIGSDYVRFSSSNTLYLKVTIPENEINHVTKGDESEIVVNARPHSEYSGEIIEKTDISNTLLSEKQEAANEDDEANDENSDADEEADEEGDDAEEDDEDDEDEDVDEDLDEGQEDTAYYTVNIKFPNDGSLRPGMSASCVITVSDRDDVLAVPVEAVKFDDDNEAYVMKAAGSDSEKVNVETGASDAMNVEILKGLKKGDTIRIERHQGKDND